jgi:hypothetical protein
VSGNDSYPGVFAGGRHRIVLGCSSRRL